MTSSPRRRALGRGLDALLSPTTQPRPLDTAGDDEAILTDLPLERIAPNPEQPRVDFDPEALDELAASIRANGVLQPIVVERASDGYRLIAGERRLRAARLAGLATIPAVVRPALESARAALELALIENLQRAELSPIEEATAFQRLGDTFGLTAEAIGLRVGRSRPAVANTMRLLSLPPSVQLALRARQLSAGHARALLGLPDAATQERVARQAIDGGHSVRGVEQLVTATLAEHAAGATGAGGNGTNGRAAGAELRGTPVPRAATPAGRDDLALCRALESTLGTPVRIDRRRRGGRVVIEFYDDDQLDGLYTAMGGRPL